MPVLLGFFTAVTAAETFTMETSYPSPLGAYDKVDLNQLRLNGYTQAEVDAGALQTAKEKLAGNPPAPLRLFYNKDRGYLYYTNPDAEKADKTTWYVKIMPDTSGQDVASRGLGACVLLQGPYANDAAAVAADIKAKKQVICQGNNPGYLKFVSPPLMGKLSAPYSLDTIAKPVAAGAWTFEAKCTIRMSGLPPIISKLPSKLYKQIRVYPVIPTKPPKKTVISYVPVDINSLLFNIGYQFCTDKTSPACVVNVPRSYINIGPSGYTPLMSAAGSLGSFTTALKTQVRMYYASGYVKTNEPTFSKADGATADDANKYVYACTKNCDNVAKDGVKALTPTPIFTLISYNFFTETLDCSDVLTARPY